MAKTAVTPSISVVTASYDGSLSTLGECLKRVRSQNYPQDKIEIILGHGGTKIIEQLANKYKALVIYVDPAYQNAEYNRGVAFNHAKKELVLILDHDNFMPTSGYLSELVQPLLDDPQIVATESCYFHYDRSFSPLDRYYALIGTLDPIPYYLGKADRMPQTSHTWTLAGKSRDLGKYYVVEFEPDPRKIPTLGTNGCLMRRLLVTANADVRPDHHYPIDVMVDVIRSGHNRFAFVKNSLIHLTGSRGVIPFLKRRLKFMSQYHFQDLSKRRYSVFIPGDELKLLKYIIYSLTWIKPTWDAFKGYLVIPDPAWFIHPVMCLGICLIYTYEYLNFKLEGH